MRMTKIAVATVFAALAACASEPPAPMTEEEAEVADIEQRLSTIQFRILQLSEQSGCTSDAQCQTVPVGSKPCGGARYFFAYSTTSMDTGGLMAAVSEYNQLEKKRAPLAGEVSNCRVITDPGAACVANRCALRQLTY